MTHLYVSSLLRSFLSLAQHWHSLVSLSEFDAELASVRVRELTCKFFHENREAMGKPSRVDTVRCVIRNNQKWDRLDTSQTITQLCGVHGIDSPPEDYSHGIFTHLHV